MLKMFLPGAPLQDQAGAEGFRVRGPSCKNLALVICAVCVLWAFAEDDDEEPDGDKKMSAEKDKPAIAATKADVNPEANAAELQKLKVAGRSQGSTGVGRRRGGR